MNERSSQKLCPDKQHFTSMLAVLGHHDQSNMNSSKNLIKFKNSINEIFTNLWLKTLYSNNIKKQMVRGLLFTCFPTISLLCNVRFANKPLITYMCEDYNKSKLCFFAFAVLFLNVIWFHYIIPSSMKKYIFVILKQAENCKYNQINKNVGAKNKALN